MTITFQDGSRVDYPTAVSASTNEDKTLLFLNDAQGGVVATMTWLDVKDPESLL